MSDHRFREAERHLLESADSDLDALVVARAATAALESGLAGATVEMAPEPAPPSWYVRAALLSLAVIVMRSARACMLVVSVGYEPEAHGLKRRLSEAHARAMAFVDDRSGQHARDWLEGKGPSTPRRVTGKYGSQQLFDLYSWNAHVEARGLISWLAVPLPGAPEHHKGLIVEPHRRVEFANGMLVEVAMEVRDTASVLARSRGGAIGNLGELDAQIDAARRRWHTPPGSQV